MKFPEAGIPQEFLRDFTSHADAFGAELFRLVSGEIKSAVNTGVVSASFEQDLKDVIIKWRGQALRIANETLHVLYTREINLQFKHYKSVIKSGETKLTLQPKDKLRTPKFFTERLRPIDAIANNIFNTAMADVRLAASVHHQLEGA